MSGWQAKRRYCEVQVVARDDGFALHLDDRPLRTPAKAEFLMPSHDMAEAVAAEWEAQSGAIDPNSMPVTRAVNAAIDKTALQHAEIAAHLAEYAQTDLICHRAAHPRELADLQAQSWDPLIDWAAKELQAPLIVTTGILPVEQPQTSLAAYHAAFQDMGAFALTGVYDLVALSGSAVLALALCHGRLEGDVAWDLSRIDERFQESLWGADEEAAAIAATKRDAFLRAIKFYRWSQPE